MIVVPAYKDKFYVYAFLQDFLLQTHFMWYKLNDKKRFKEHLEKLKEQLLQRINLIVDIDVDILFDETLWQPTDKGSIGSIAQINIK